MGVVEEDLTIRPLRKRPSRVNLFKVNLEQAKTKPWWNYLIENQKDLLEQSFILLGREEKGNDNFHDYAFIIFSAAKAYEGFLKSLFLDLGLIDEYFYSNKHFRIGKALNPNLPEKYRGDGWVFGKLENFCQGRKLPDYLWEVWIECRNLVFHWFPGHKNFISLEDAKRKLQKIVEAMDMAFESCKTSPSVDVVHSLR